MEWITNYCFRKHNVYQNTKEAIKICLKDAEEWSEKTGIKIEFFPKKENRFGREFKNILKVYSENKNYYYRVHSHSIGYLEVKSCGYNLGNFKAIIKDEHFKMFLPQLSKILDME